MLSVAGLRERYFKRLVRRKASGVKLLRAGAPPREALQLRGGTARRQIDCFSGLSSGDRFDALMVRLRTPRYGRTPIRSPKAKRAPEDGSLTARNKAEGKVSPWLSRPGNGRKSIRRVSVEEPHPSLRGFRQDRDQPEIEINQQTGKAPESELRKPFSSCGNKKMSISRIHSQKILASFGRAGFFCLAAGKGNGSAPRTPPFGRPTLTLAAWQANRSPPHPRNRVANGLSSGAFAPSARTSRSRSNRRDA